jgi:hypothetical protein
MARVAEADTTEERVEATRALAVAIDEATGGLATATDEGVALYNALIEAALAGLDLRSVDLPGELAAAAANATSLADEMSRAASNAITMAAQSFDARRDAEIRLANAGDPVATAAALAASRFDRENAALLNAPVGGSTFAQARETYIENAIAAAEAQLALQEFNDTLRSSGGAARDATDERALEAERLFESTRTAAERYAAELAKVEDLYQSGAIDADVYGRALEQLEENFDPLTQLIDGISDTVENELNAAFAAVLDGTATLGDALLDFASNVLAKVAQDLFAQQFAQPIASGISDFASALFSANGNVFTPAGVTPFANGGVVSGPTVFPFANGIGVMGEAGPEAIMPLSRGSDGKLGVVANGNSAPRVVINNYSGQEATASTDGAGNILVEIGRAVAQDITAGGPTYRAIRTTFGLSNRLQQRG